MNREKDRLNNEKTRCATIADSMEKELERIARDILDSPSNETVEEEAVKWKSRLIELEKQQKTLREQLEERRKDLKSVLLDKQRNRQVVEAKLEDCRNNKGNDVKELERLRKKALYAIDEDMA